MSREIRVTAIFGSVELRPYKYMPMQTKDGLDGYGLWYQKITRDADGLITEIKLIEPACIIYYD